MPRIDDKNSVGKPSVKCKLIASYLPMIERSLAQGYTHAQIYQWLLDQGIKISFRYYETSLFRLRKNRAKSPQASVVSASGAQVLGVGGMQLSAGNALATSPNRAPKVEGQIPKTIMELRTREIKKW
jgi:hypothetical protein